MSTPCCDCIPPDGDDWSKPWIRECEHHEQQRQRLEAIHTIVARMRKDLEKVGGFENILISVPAGGVRDYIEELEKAINGNG